MGPMHAAFVPHDGVPCGHGAPGRSRTAREVIDEIRLGVPSHVTGDLTAEIAVTDARIRARMSGDICRCEACATILPAITRVAADRA